MNETTLTKLLQIDTSGVKASIYQPTHPASSEQTVREDAIRFKNALRAIRSDEAYDASLSETMTLLDELVDDSEFWKHQSRGVAVFVDQHGYQTVRLHYDVTSAYFVSKQFQLSPLILAGSMGTDYFLLGVNHTRPRLLAGSPSHCSELLLEDMPGSFESMTENIEYTHELQHQSGGVSAFHGHSDEAAQLDATNKYYRKIAASVDSYLTGHTEPLLLIGVENSVGTIRKFISYPHVLAEYSEGNDEAMNEQEMYDVVIPIIEQYNTNRRDDLIKTFQETTPALIAVGADEVGAALAEHRVATLLLPSFRRTTDTVREGYEQSIVLQLHEADGTNVETIVRSTISQGGQVVAVAVDSFEDEQPRAQCRF